MTDNQASDRRGLTAGQLLGISALLLLIDQATKVWIKGFNFLGVTHDGMYIGESHPLLGNFLRISFTENPGMAFGIDTGLPFVLGTFSIIASIFLVYLIYRTPQNSRTAGFRLALAVILGGAIGNLIDRVFYGIFYGYAGLFEGRVVDFISFDMPDVNIFNTHLDRFWTFNIADSAVTVGIVILLFSYSRYQKFMDEKKRREAGEITEETEHTAAEQNASADPSILSDVQSRSSTAPVEHLPDSSLKQTPGRLPDDYTSPSDSEPDQSHPSHDRSDGI